MFQRQKQESIGHGAIIIWHSYGGDPPIAGWFMRENPTYKWMMTGGTPISGNPHMGKTMP